MGLGHLLGMRRSGASRTEQQQGRTSRLSRRRRRTLGAALTLALAATLLGQAPAARALVPYVFVPQKQELNGAGLGIAQAAARLLRLGQADDAARLAELTVRLLPSDPRGWILLAEARVRSGEADLALAALSRAKQLDPGNAGIWFAEGSLELRKNRPAQALPLLRRGLELDPRNAGGYFDLGNTQLLLLQPNQALRSYEQAAKLRPSFWEAINNQGLVLFEAGRIDDALQRWRQVLKIKPDVAETSLAVAAVLIGRGPGDQRDALRLAQQALAEDPNYVLDGYRKEQLWGERLQAATRLLLARPELKPNVDRANANAGSEREQDGP